PGPTHALSRILAHRSGHRCWSALAPVRCLSSPVRCWRGLFCNETTAAGVKAAETPAQILNQEAGYLFAPPDERRPGRCILEVIEGDRGGTKHGPERTRAVDKKRQKR